MIKTVRKRKKTKKAPKINNMIAYYSWTFI